MTANSPNAISNFARDEAIDFADAYDVPVNHPQEHELRWSFEFALEERINKAISDTVKEFSDRATKMADEDIPF